MRSRRTILVTSDERWPPAPVCAIMHRRSSSSISVSSIQIARLGKQYNRSAFKLTSEGRALTISICFARRSCRESHSNSSSQEKWINETATMRKTRKLGALHRLRTSAQTFSDPSMWGQVNLYALRLTAHHNTFWRVVWKRSSMTAVGANRKMRILWSVHETNHARFPGSN